MPQFAHVYPMLLSVAVTLLLAVGISYVLFRRRVSHILRQSDEQRFRDFFADSPLGVAMYDARRNVVHVNAACLKIFGAPDRNEFARFDLFDNPFIPHAQREALKRGESVRLEMNLDFEDARKQNLFTTTRKGSGCFDIWVNNLGLDAESRPRGYLAEIQDSTRRREMETALLDSERQLRQSRKMQAIGTLSGGIAHDFNNILTPILGYAEMLLHTMPEDAPTRDFVTEILKASHRAKELVTQILTLSRQNEHAGRVATKPGEGTTFNVLLPTVERDHEQESDTRNPLPAGHECILLVDDDAEIGRMEAQILATWGYTPIVAQGGREALRCFTAEPGRFDIVITDQVMPDLTGLELARKLREIQPSLPVIICTGFSETLTPEAVADAGVCELVMKPIGMRQLAEAVRRALARTPATEGMAGHTPEADPAPAP